MFAAGLRPQDGGCLGLWCWPAQVYLQQCRSLHSLLTQSPSQIGHGSVLLYCPMQRLLLALSGRLSLRCCARRTLTAVHVFAMLATAAGCIILCCAHFQETRLHAWKGTEFQSRVHTYSTVHKSLHGTHLLLSVAAAVALVGCLCLCLPVEQRQAQHRLFIFSLVVVVVLVAVVCTEGLKLCVACVWELMACLNGLLYICNPSFQQFNWQYHLNMIPMLV